MPIVDSIVIHQNKYFNEKPNSCFLVSAILWSIQWSDVGLITKTLSDCLDLEHSRMSGCESYLKVNVVFHPCTRYSMPATPAMYAWLRVQVYELEWAHCTSSRTWFLSCGDSTAVALLREAVHCMISRLPVHLLTSSQVSHDCWFCSYSNMAKEKTGTQFYSHLMVIDWQL